MPIAAVFLATTLLSATLSSATLLSATLSNGGTHLAFHPGGRPVSLRIRANTPVVISVAAQGGKPASQHRLDAAAAARLTTIVVPSGESVLAVASPGHRTVRRLVGPDTTTLGDIAMSAAPAIEGRVAGPGEKPLRAVEVRSQSGRILARSGSDGTFRFHVEDDWPEALLVVTPRLGSRTVLLPKVWSDLSLGTIPFGLTSTLDVIVERPTPVPVDVMLLARSEGTDPLRTIRLSPRAKVAKFDRLQSGKYVIAVRGAAPLEQWRNSVTLGEGEHKLERAAIEPVTLRVAARLGSDPLANATLSLKNTKWDWLAAVHTDANGVVEAPLWQMGDFLTSIAASGLRSQVVMGTRLYGVGTIEWPVELPRRSVTGRVVDEAGQGVAGARIMLKSRGVDHNPLVVTHSDRDGRYAYDAVPAGEQSVTVQADGYLLPDPVGFRLGEDDRGHEVIVPLRRGAARSVRVLQTNGNPSGGAYVLAVAAGALTSKATTDLEGRASFSTAGNPPVLVFVVAPDGSFAARRDPAADQELVVRLPEARSSLRIALRTAAGVPVSRVRLMMRLDGELVSPAVLEYMEVLQGIRLQSNRAGEIELSRIPAGTYEFWPWRTPAEAEDINASASSGADWPIRVQVAEGENHAEITFESVR